MVHCTWEYSLHCFPGNTATQISMNTTEILCSGAKIAVLLALSLGAGLPWVTFFYHSEGLPRTLRLSQAMNLFWTRESNRIIFSFSFRYRRWTSHDSETTSFWSLYYLHKGTAVAQWLRCCATNLKVAGSIPASVNGFFIDIKSFRSHYGPGVDSAFNRNEYQELFLGVKAAGA